MGANCPPVFAARITPVGRGAVATVRVSSQHSKMVPRLDQKALAGIDSLFSAANGLPLSDQPPGKIAFGQWGIADFEDVVVCRLAANVVEIHCHGGEAAVQRVLHDLSTVGCRIVDWQEHFRTTESLLEAECADVLSRTSTWRTTRIVLEQANGLLKTAFERLSQLNEHAETELNREVDELLKRATFGLHLSMPWSVVLTGRPNVGKSSLINALLGYQRAIVFDEPGTTRDVVTGETAFDGWPVVLADTAGIRETAGTLEAAGIALARSRLESADLRIVLIDTSQAPTNEDERLLSEWPDALFVAHKSDLPNQWRERMPKNAVAVSSVTGDGLSELQTQLISRLIPTIPKPRTPVPITARQVEILREIRSAPNDQSRREVIERLLATRRIA